MAATCSMGRGAIGSTSDSGSEGSRFESWQPSSQATEMQGLTTSCRLSRVGVLLSAASVAYGTQVIGDGGAVTS